MVSIAGKRFPQASDNRNNGFDSGAKGTVRPASLAKFAVEFVFLELHHLAFVFMRAYHVSSQSLSAEDPRAEGGCPRVSP